MFKVKFTPRACKDLKRLAKDIQRRVIKKTKFYSRFSQPLVFSKPLVDFPPSTHRFRVGQYRIAFHLWSGILVVDRVKHRREVYRR